MNLPSACLFFVALLAGYLLGSISPAYLLGRWLKHIDIRQHGTKNAGTVNTYHVLGIGPAVLTAMIDVSKGLMAMFLGQVITASSTGGYLAAAAAILGHVFPFYLRFNGGQGVATATGLMLFFLARFYFENNLPLLSLAILGFATISFAWIARQGEFVGLFLLPSLVLLLFVYAPASTSRHFLCTLAVYILAINILNIWRQRLWSASAFSEKGLIGWRLYLRPLAFLIVLLTFSWEKKQSLTLVGGITLFFLLPDLVRLTSHQVNRFIFFRLKKIYKEKERRRFSSITLFLLSFFLTLLLFDRDIAILAITFLTFGDFYSKIYGLRFGRTPLYEKSLQGSLAHFNACLVSGYLLLHFLNISLPICLLGAFTASVAEALPLGIDDNLSVSLLSASVMHVALLF